MKTPRLWLVALILAMASDAGAQQYVYPAHGQSPQHQQKDEAHCYGWAVKQTGFDPALAPPPSGPQTTATGVTPGAGVAGAAGGAAIGAVAGGGSGAGIGAVSGAVVARGISRHRNAVKTQQAQQAYQAQQAAFGKARAACLEGRGYTVK
jgi:hypothetical protein